MREAIGNSFVLNFIITFLFLFMLIFVATLSYTKAFKVKNRIIDTIENYDGNITNGNQLADYVQQDIDAKLSEIGYRISDKTTCENSRYADDSNMTELPKPSGSNSTYRYCIYKSTTSRGDYYSVVAYIYFEVPLIGAKLEFPVYGETRVFMNL